MTLYSEKKIPLVLQDYEVGFPLQKASPQTQMGKYTFNEAHCWKLNNIIFSIFFTKQNDIFDQSRNSSRNFWRITVLWYGQYKWVTGASHLCGVTQTSDSISSEHFCPHTRALSFLVRSWLPEALTDIKISLSWALSAWIPWFTDITTWIGKTTKGWVEGVVLWPRFNSTSADTQLFRVFFQLTTAVLVPEFIFPTR